VQNTGAPHTYPRTAQRHAGESGIHASPAKPTTRQKSKHFFFVNKKEAKKTLPGGLWQRWCQRPAEQKFFASFFQKRSACFPSRAQMHGLETWRKDC
jgi:hypothetical protein